MYYKLTNRNQNEQVAQLSPHLPLPSINHAYSFAQPNQQHEEQLASLINIQKFVAGIVMVQELLDISTSVNLSSVLLINCADADMVQQALRDHNLDPQIKKRMAKYLNLVELTSLGCPDTPQTKYISINIDTEQKLPNFSNSDPIDEGSKKNESKNISNSCVIGVKQYNHNHESVKQNKKIVASRYINSKQQYANTNNSNKQKITDMTPSRAKSRSISNSQFSHSHSKPFHKIQLKSVKKFDKNESIVKEKEKREKIKKNKDSKMKQKEQINKRYTISHKNKQKKNKTISNQIGNMNENSRLTVSRLKQTQNGRNKLDRSSILVSDKDKKGITSRSRYKNEENGNKQLSPKHCKQNCHRCERCDKREKNKSNACSKDTKGSRIKSKQFGIQTEISNNNLVHETVQKSNDFLMMLKMMGEQ